MDPKTLIDQIAEGRCPKKVLESDSNVRLVAFELKNLFDELLLDLGQRFTARETQIWIEDNLSSAGLDPDPELLRKLLLVLKLVNERVSMTKGELDADAPGDF